MEPQDQDHSYKSLTDSITRASTIVFKDAESFRCRDWRDLKSFSYGLQATPIVRRLQRKLASLDGVDYCLLYPSGLNAISMLLYSMLEPGDHVLIGNNVYEPTKEICLLFAKKINVSVSFYDSLSLSDLIITSKTKLIWVESPGSITMEVSDLKTIASIAKKNNIKIAYDATWSAHVAFLPFQHGADVVVYALTKYHSGGSDVLMGAISIKDKKDFENIHQARKVFGIGVSPDDCYLVLRSLAHLKLRYLAQDESARKVATWLNNQTEIKRVFHPALPTSPGHKHWIRDYSAAASIFSVEFNSNLTQYKVDQFINALELFKIGASWGGPVSLVIPLTKNQVHQKTEIVGCVIRLYIGLEETEDLILDIQYALDKMKKG
jgi:cystathionine beta-lyase